MIQLDKNLTAFGTNVPTTINSRLVTIQKSIVTSCLIRSIDIVSNNYKIIIKIRQTEKIQISYQNKLSL